MDTDNTSFSEALYQQLRDGKFSFIDLGCGMGESISYCEKMFQLGKGIGFDIDNEKIKKAQESHRNALLADVTKVAFGKKVVRFCAMMDFLEHLKSLESAKEVILKASGLAQDFLFIRHPSFEDIDYLRDLGMKIDWTHWTGHTNMMKVEDFENLFLEFGWHEYVIVPRKQILTSDNPCIVPLSAPKNTIRYDPELHDKKPIKTFERIIWTQFDIYVKLNKTWSHKEWNEVIQKSQIL